MKQLTGLMLVAALAAGCGGGDDQVIRDAGTDGATDGATDGGTDAPGYYLSVPVTANRNLDLLFVVDNSGSMATEQQQLAANFPQLIGVLSQVLGGLPDLHVGVVSSNVGGAGAVAVPGCAAQGDDGNLLTGPPGNTCATQFGLQDSFISDVASPDGSRNRNYTGDLAGLFTCMASLGTDGCGFEMHLESMYRSLQPGKNPGFYRADAHLAVVILADEDDCSTQDGTMFGDPNAGLASALGPRNSFRCFEFGVRCQNDPNPRAFGTKTGCVPDPSSPFMYEVGRYVDFLRTLKDGSAEVVVAAIAGIFDPVTGSVTVGANPFGSDETFPSVLRSCFAQSEADPNDGATPPVRLQSFLAGFPGHNAFTTICDQNLADAMVQIGVTIKAALGHPCIEATLGPQPTCTASDVLDPDGPNRTAIPLPACETVVQSGASCVPGNAGTPCWCFHPDVLACPATGDNPGSLALGVARGGAIPPLGTVVELYCRAD